MVCQLHEAALHSLTIFHCVWNYRFNDDSSVQYGTVSIENNKLFVTTERVQQTRRKLCLNMKVIPIDDSWGNLCRNEELAMSILFVKCSKCDGRMTLVLILQILTNFRKQLGLSSRSLSLACTVGRVTHSLVDIILICFFYICMCTDNSLLFINCLWANIPSKMYFINYNYDGTVNIGHFLCFSLTNIGLANVYMNYSEMMLINLSTGTSIASQLAKTK